MTVPGLKGKTVNHEPELYSRSFSPRTARLFSSHTNFGVRMW